MITIDGKEYRTIQEQVEKNRKDIQAILNDDTSDDSKVNEIQTALNTEISNRQAQDEDIRNDLDTKDTAQTAALNDTKSKIAFDKNQTIILPITSITANEAKTYKPAQAFPFTEAVKNLLLIDNSGHYLTLHLTQDLNSTFHYYASISSNTSDNQLQLQTFEVNISNTSDNAYSYSYSYSTKNYYQFKTLFGNQSIVGSGNIDLYMHRVRLRMLNRKDVDGNSLRAIPLSISFISTKNTKITTLELFNEIYFDQTLTPTSTSTLPVSPKLTAISINGNEIVLKRTSESDSYSYFIPFTFAASPSTRTLLDCDLIGIRYAKTDNSISGYSPSILIIMAGGNLTFDDDIVTTI